MFSDISTNLNLERIQRLLKTVVNIYKVVTVHKKCYHSLRSNIKPFRNRILSSNLIVITTNKTVYNNCLIEIETYNLEITVYINR